MPAETGPNHCGSLQCKVNTGASGNVMPLHIFAKLFPRYVTTDGKPTRLHPMTPDCLHTMDQTFHNLEPYTLLLNGPPRAISAQSISRPDGM